ncbi:MAG: universal stress protein [Nitriliruptorales bacterium]|nr:universal stress protein [Nitriliruptorales bacterium]
MSSYRHVIVGTDGSGGATCAVHAAVTVAGALSAPLHIATAWYRDQPDEPVPSERSQMPGGSPAGHESTWATETTSEAAAVARQAGLEDVRQAQPIGGAADALIQVGEDHPESLLVVGTRGLDSRSERLVGNVPHQLTHHSTRDLLLVSTTRDCEDGRSWDRVALATDGSETAAVACEHGHALAQTLGATPVFLIVAKDEDRGQQVAERASRAYDGAAELDHEVVISGSVSDALVDAAGDYDLLVIGNKGMSGPSRLLGSVANRVTHRVPTDLLLVNTSR